MRLDRLADTAVLAARAQPKLNQLKKATQDVEAVFLKDLLSQMRRSIPKDDQNSSFGSDIYQDMFDQAFAQGVSSTGSMGIAKMIFERMANTVLAQEKARYLLQADRPNTENKG